MAQTPMLANLRYSEFEHGWVLDVGCFLAARCTALGDLAYTQDEHTRNQIFENIRSHSVNIQHRLASHGSRVDGWLFDPGHFHHTGSMMAKVAARILDTHSAVHCVFLLLGCATTFVELGMRSGLRQACYESAESVIRQLLALGSNMFPVGTQMEALRFELSMLGGNVERLRRVLSATAKARSADSSYVFIADIRKPAVGALSGEDTQRRLVAVVL